MSHKRSISSEMCTDERLAEVASEMPLAAVLWPWILLLLDDWGRAEFRPMKAKLALFPGCQLVSADILEQSIDTFTKHGLLAKYEVDGKTFIALHPRKWIKFQTYLVGTKRANHASPLPGNPAWTEEECQETWMLMTMKGERSKVSRCQLTSADDSRQEAVSVPSPSPSPLKSPLTPHEGGGEGDADEQPAKKRTRKAPTDEYTPDFEAAWKEYPRSDDKRGALLEWKKAKKRGMPVDRMPEIIQTQCQAPEWRKDGGQFVPHMRKWLHGDGWLKVTEAEPTPQIRGRPLTEADHRPPDYSHAT